jgi:hypothetical protein
MTVSDNGMISPMLDAVREEAHGEKGRYDLRQLNSPPGNHSEKRRR